MEEWSVGARESGEKGVKSGESSKQSAAIPPRLQDTINMTTMEIFFGQRNNTEIIYALSCPLCAP